MKNRIFIGLEEIAGWGYSLQEGFKSEGLDAKFYSLARHPFQYSNSDKYFIKWMQSFVGYKNKFRKKSLLRKTLMLFEEFLRSMLLIFFLFKYDIFIFIFHSTFLNKQRDLPILKFFHKKIIILECGSEARPPYVDGFIFPHYSYQEIVSWSSGRKAKIRWIEKYADYIISHPPISMFHEKQFINFLNIGIAKMSNEFKKEHKFKLSENMSVKIVHAPSSPQGKGTFIIHEIIDELIQNGYKIDFIELRGQPNNVVLNILEDCDFIIDQMYGDSPMAGFVMEAAWFGKPAVVGGEYATYISMEMPKQIIPPAEYVRPDCVKNAVERLIVDVEYRKELGYKAYNFVHNQWSLENVIERFIKIIKDDVPKEWYFNPNLIHYPYGGGASLDRIAECIRGIVTQYGVEALQVHDKPHIEKMYLDLIEKKYETHSRESYFCL